MKKLTTDEFVEKARKTHGDKYNYSKVEYVNSCINVIIICPIHGEFLQNPNSHLNGKGCLNCANKNKKLTIYDFIKKARNIHEDKYDYSKVEYVNNKTKVIIICSKHGEFLQIPSSHLSGNGCYDCNGIKKLTKVEFIERAKKIHGNKYDYSEVEYINNYTKVIIICPIHGEFLQNPNSHLNGSGCLDCANENQKLTINEFIEKAKKIHGDKYDYSKVEYINNYTKIIIICPTHGEFLQIPSSHLSGNGCFNCANEILKSTKEEFIEKARKIHGDKYDYTKVEYVNNYTKVIIICPTHGEFLQIPTSHLIGKGCSKCSNLISKLSQAWLDTYNIPKKNREKLIKVSNKRFYVDGFDPQTNTIFEFYGDYWHGNPKIYKPNDINIRNKKSFGKLHNNTIKRENILKSAGYTLITIWESDYYKMKK